MKLITQWAITHQIIVQQQLIVIHAYFKIDMDNTVLSNVFQLLLHDELVNHKSLLDEPQLPNNSLK